MTYYRLSDCEGEKFYLAIGGTQWAHDEIIGTYLCDHCHCSREKISAEEYEAAMKDPANQ